MRRSALKALRLYAARTAVNRPTGPALLLDARLWDLQRTPSGPVFSLAPEGSVWGGRQGPGTRVGVLAVRARPGATLTGDITDHDIAALLDELSSSAGAKRFHALEATAPAEVVDQAVDELLAALRVPLVPAVLTPQNIVSLWEAPSVRYRCPGCESPVPLDAMDRIRYHETSGVRCPAVRTRLREEERKARVVKEAGD